MWLEPSPVEISESFRAAVGGHPLVAEILVRRGLNDPAVALGFLDPHHYIPAPPSELPDLERAAQMLYDAVVRRRPILVWGDFDVDGQTATALLVSALRDLGAEVAFYIPQRLTESHGIRIASLDRVLNARHVDVLLTCDTGITEHAAIQHARARGLTVLVTDHHDLADTLPEADALVDPKRLPIGHSLRDLPGVGVAFKLAQQLDYLSGQAVGADGLLRHLDLVALGIVADVARQVFDTRYLLQLGLEQLRQSKRLGLQTLMQFARLDPAHLTADHIGFGLGPRLNAIGRLGDAALAVELLATADLTRARIIASQIEALNNQRRILTEQIYAAAQEQIAKDSSLLDGSVLVLSNPHWHAGVIGPVAARLAEKHARPAVLLVASEDGRARGSARSVPGVDISSALTSVREWLTAFGGHPGAAGVSLRADDIPVFRAALSHAVDAVWDRSVAPVGTPIDAVVSLGELTIELAQQIERLAPFGEGNPPLTLAVRDLVLADSRTFGRRGEHRELTVADGRGGSRRVVWWRGADEDLPEGRLDVAVTIKSTDFRGAPALSIEWVEARAVQAARVEVAAPALEAVDWRGVPDLAARLGEMRGSPPAIWADGEIPEGIPACRRYDLKPAESLVIWRAPAGPKELATAVEHVAPKRICICDADPTDDGVEAFVRRLAGLLKHDLNRREGHVDVPRLAVAAGQRAATVRKGIEWLAAKGQLAILENQPDELRIGPALPPLPVRDDSLEEIELQLRALLAETAAYRAYYRRSPAAQLIPRT